MTRRKLLLWFCSGVCLMWAAVALVLVVVAGTPQPAFPSRAAEPGSAALFCGLAALTAFAALYLAIRGAEEP